VQEEVRQVGGEAEWFAVYTAPRHEKQVAHQLNQRSVECFLPLYESVRRWKTGPARLELPLFPSYLFVRADRRERRKVVELPSVVNIIGNRLGPTAISKEEIESLRRVVVSGKPEPHGYLEVGTRVRVVCGPLLGVEGVLVRRKGSLKLVVSVQTIMQSVAMEVAASDVEPVPGVTRSRVQGSAKN
jgi:transcription antitermination factor NusG